MKNLKIILFGLLLAGFVVSCSDDDSSPANNNAQHIQQVIATAQSGVWRITSYVDSGVVETNNFTGYNFSFNSNGTLAAVNGSSTHAGTWSVTNSSNSNDDDDSGDIDFNIAFNVPAPGTFLDLNDDWDIVEYTANKISLVDMSGGNGGYDYVTFEKN